MPTPRITDPSDRPLPPYDLTRATRSIAAADADFARLIEVVGPCGLRLDGRESPFHSLIRSILFQQLNGKAATTIMHRMLDLWDGRFPTPVELLAVDAETLRTCGVSGNKARALHSLAEHAMDGTVPIDADHPLGDADPVELVKRLTQVRGVGPWTVEMLLIFHIGHPDVISGGDFGLRAGYQRLRGLPEPPTPKQLVEAGEQWAPWRSVASWYLWRAAELPADVTV